VHINRIAAAKYNPKRLFPSVGEAVGNGVVTRLTIYWLTAVASYEKPPHHNRIKINELLLISVPLKRFGTVPGLGSRGVGKI